MLGKVTKQDTYLIMPPYKAYWPRVFEVHYEPSPEEYGKEPRFGFQRDQWWRYLAPRRLDASDSRATIPFKTEHGGDDATRKVPLRAILEAERDFFRAFGPAGYDQHPMRDFYVTHLVLERDGEVLAEYVAGAPQVLHPENFRFADSGEPGHEEPRQLGFDWPKEFVAEHLWATPREIHLERMTEEERVKYESPKEPAAVEGMREGGSPKSGLGFFIIQAGKVHPDRWTIIPSVGWDARWFGSALDQMGDAIFDLVRRIRFGKPKDE